MMRGCTSALTITSARRRSHALVPFPEDMPLCCAKTEQCTPCTRRTACTRANTTAEREGLRQPVASLTALARETDRVRALESGFDVHIQKPVEPRALAKAVAELVSTRTS